MRKWQIVLLSFVLAGIVLATVLYILVYNKSHPDYEKAKPEWTMSAMVLYSSFRGDEVAANNTYAGKVIAIDGQVGNVEQVDGLVIVSFIFEEGFFGGEGVRCTILEGYHERALELSTGENVVIKGLCTGFTGSDVILEHCSFL